MSESDFNNTIVREHFTTPEACYAALARRYGGGDGSHQDGSEYLFRGEARYYPTSTPGTYRALTAGSSIGIKLARIDATGLFVEAYEEAGGDPEIGESLAQHYLSTSDGLDFSASLGVALAFALDERNNDPPRNAYIAVLNRESADSSDRFCLRDLREEAEAFRPVRQCGFVAVHHAGNFVDLKDADCRRQLELVWYSFTVVTDDVAGNRHAAAPRLDDLYDIRGDLWAARMIQYLDGLVGDPSPQWGQDGLHHLIEARDALLSRRG